nr:MAG TPA: hypothetical protein [Caudoviricetes sp.]
MRHHVFTDKTVNYIFHFSFLFLVKCFISQTETLLVNNAPVFSLLYIVIIYTFAGIYSCFD